VLVDNYEIAGGGIITENIDSSSFSLQERIRQHVFAAKQRETRPVEEFPCIIARSYVRRIVDSRVSLTSLSPASGDSVEFLF
jgi:hypothetical protein